MHVVGQHPLLSREHGTSPSASKNIWHYVKYASEGTHVITFKLLIRANDHEVTVKEALHIKYI